MFTNESAWMYIEYLNNKPSVERTKATNIILGLLFVAIGIGLYLKNSF